MAIQQINRNNTINERLFGLAKSLRRCRGTFVRYICSISLVVFVCSTGHAQQADSGTVKFLALWAPYATLSEMGASFALEFNGNLYSVKTLDGKRDLLEFLTPDEEVVCLDLKLETSWYDFLDTLVKYKQYYHTRTGDPKIDSNYYWTCWTFDARFTKFNSTVYTTLSDGNLIDILSDDPMHPVVIQSVAVSTIRECVWDDTKFARLIAERELLMKLLPYNRR